jgi:hypothetical protein
MSRRFAEGTRVTVKQTIADIESLLFRYGADRIEHMVDGGNDCAIFQFELDGQEISFEFPLPEDPFDPNAGKERRRIYRAVLRAIHGKLESVASGIESPAQAFMAQLITEDGETFFEKVKPMLPAPKQKNEPGASESSAPQQNGPPG